MPPGSLSSKSSSPENSASDSYRIGPMISSQFYRALDGIIEHPGCDLTVPNTPSYDSLHALRGPFPHASDYLKSSLRAQLHKISIRRSETLASLVLEGAEYEVEIQGRMILQRAEKVLRKAIELCHVYPGDEPVPGDISTPERPFTIKLDDFRLVNLLVSLGSLYFAHHSRSS